MFYFFILQGAFNVLSGQLIFYDLFKKKDLSSVAQAWPHLTSLNAYYRFNVSYHAISELWTKSDKPAASNHFKEPGMSH